MGWDHTLLYVYLLFNLDQLFSLSQHDLDNFEKYWLVILYKIPSIDSLMWSHEYIEVLCFCQGYDRNDVFLFFSASYQEALGTDLSHFW